MCIRCEKQEIVVHYYTYAFKLKLLSPIGEAEYNVIGKTKLFTLGKTFNVNDLATTVEKY